jgi:hypothetical protein
MNFLSSRIIVAQLAAAPFIYDIVAMLLSKAELIIPSLGLNPLLSAAVIAALPILTSWLRTKTTAPLDQRPNFTFLGSEAKFPVINQ